MALLSSTSTVLQWAMVSVCILLTIPQSNAHISHVSVLIPAPTSLTSTANFPLMAYDGCYQWETLNTTLLSLTPVQDAPPKEHCASAAFLRPSVAGISDHTKVVARDGANVLTCDVFVAPLKWLQVLTTTRKIVVDEMHVLAAQAFDREGNVFTSLHGLKFEWEFATKRRDAVESYIELLPVDDESIELAKNVLTRIAISGDDAVSTLEDETVVVKGVRPGRVWLSLRVPREGLEAKEVEFNVVDNLQIVPPFLRHSVLRVMLNEKTPVPFKLKRRRAGQWDLVDSYVDGFVWSISRSSIASIEPITGHFLSYGLGQALIDIKDQNFEANAAQQVVQVVHPAHVIAKFHLISSKVPGIDVGYSSFLKRQDTIQQKHLLSDSSYIVEIEVYDADFKRIYIQQVAPVALETISTGTTVYDHTSVLRASDSVLNYHKIENNYTIAENFFVFPTQSAGKARMQICLMKTNDAAITHVGLQQSDEETTGQQEQNCEILHSVDLRVDDRISIEHAFAENYNQDGVIYLPLHQNIRQRYAPKIRGGSGEYQIFKLDSQGPIDVVDMTTLVAKDIRGDTTVMVVDVQNPDNNMTVDVVVALPDSLEVGPGPRDTPLGQTLDLALILKDPRGRSFTAFDMLPLKWFVMNPSIFTIIGKPLMKATLLSQQSVGSTQVEVSLGNTHIMATTEVSTFKPMSLSPEDTVLAIAPGSTLRLELEGGPARIHSFTSDFSSEITTDGGFATVEKVDLTTYTIKCGHHVGKQSFTVTYTHKLHMPNAQPSVWTLKRDIACAVPNSMAVAPIPRKGVTEGAAPDSYNVYMKSVGETLLVRPIFFTEDGKQFVAHDSLVPTWKVSNKTVMSVTSGPDHTQAILHSHGQGMITARVDGFTFPMNPKPTFQASMLLVVLPTLGVTPEHSLLWGSPLVVQTLDVVGGSGRYTYTYPPLDAVAFNEKRGGMGLHVRWVGTGSGLPRDLQVKVQDQVYSHVTATATVRVADLSTLKANATDLYIQLGFMEAIQLVALDDSDTPFPAEQCEKMAVQTGQSHKVLEITPRERCIFDLKAIGSGRSTIYFEVTNAGGQTVRAPVEVYVFQEELVVPREMGLKVGIGLQLTFVGGVPGSKKLKKDFASDDPRIATVDSHGVVTGVRAGHTTLTVSWTTNGIGNQKRVEVVVVKALSNVRLQLIGGDRVIQTGDVMQLSVIGEADLPNAPGRRILLNPMFYMDAGPKTMPHSRTSFSWTVQGSAVKMLQSLPSSDAPFQGMFSAVDSGKARIIVDVTDGGSKFSASLDIQVGAKTLCYDCLSGLLLPTHTSFVFPFDSATYTLARDETEGSATRLSTNILDTEGQGSASIAVVPDEDTDLKKVLAINVASPRYMRLKDIGSQSRNTFSSHTVALNGSTISLKVIMEDQHGSEFYHFNEGDLKAFSNHPSVASVMGISASEAKCPMTTLTINASTIGVAMMEVSFVGKQHQKGDWRTVPAFPIRGFSSTDPRPGPPVVTSSWMIRVVEEISQAVAFPGAIIHMQGKEGRVNKGTVLSDDWQRCLPSGNVVALSTHTGLCGLTFMDPPYSSYHVDLSIQSIKTVRFMDRSIVATVSPSTMVYITKIPIVFYGEDSMPLGIEFETKVKSSIKKLLSMEPQEMEREVRPKSVRVAMPEQLSCEIMGGDALETSASLKAEVVAHRGQLYCVIYSSGRKSSNGTMDRSRDASYEVLVKWGSQLHDVAHLRLLEMNEALDMERAHLGWSWFAILLTMLLMYIGYRILKPVFTEVSLRARQRPTRAPVWRSELTSTGQQGPMDYHSFDNRKPMLIPHATGVNAPGQRMMNGGAHAGANGFNPFGAPTHRRSYQEW